MLAQQACQLELPPTPGSAPSPDPFESQGRGATYPSTHSNRYTTGSEYAAVMPQYA